MSKYIARLNHFSIEKEGSTAIVTSERSSGFEKSFDWPDVDPDADDVKAKLHAALYLDAKQAYNEYHN